MVMSIPIHRLTKLHHAMGQNHRAMAILEEGPEVQMSLFNNQTNKSVTSKFSEKLWILPVWLIFLWTWKKYSHKQPQRIHVWYIILPTLGLNIW